MTERAAVGVSIVLPYYNGSAFIAATIESVLAQTYRNFELIVVDDGSIETEALQLTRLISDCRDDRILYVRKENGGLSDARNYGVRRAAAELVCLLDQDDLWEPEKLARQVAVMESMCFVIG